MDSAQLVLASYVGQLQEVTMRKTGRPPAPKTLMMHLNAACLFLEQATGLTIPLKETTGDKHPKLLDIFADIFSLSQKWREPKAKREAFTWKIFEALQEMVREETEEDITCFLDLVATVFDWLCLGCFTGCRPGEYAQTEANSGQYSKVPNNVAAGPWGGYATAFVKEDFTFLDKDTHVLPNDWTTLKRPKKVFELHVRWRFDKSKNNFIIRKYRRGSGFLCPLEASLSILRRALILKVGEKEPLAVYRKGTRGRYTYLRSSEIIQTVRDACVRAYPDPNHFLRLNSDRLVAHSNRVTAAVALKLKGWTEEAIADRLRWTVQSVKHYLRESSQLIGDMTASAIAGAMLL